MVSALLELVICPQGRLANTFSGVQGYQRKISFELAQAIERCADFLFVKQDRYLIVQSEQDDAGLSFVERLRIALLDYDIFLKGIVTKTTPLLACKGQPDPVGTIRRLSEAAFFEDNLEYALNLQADNLRITELKRKLTSFEQYEIHVDDAYLTTEQTVPIFIKYSKQKKYQFYWDIRPGDNDFSEIRIRHLWDSYKRNCQYDKENTNSLFPLLQLVISSVAQYKTGNDTIPGFLYGEDLLKMVADLIFSELRNDPRLSVLACLLYLRAISSEDIYFRKIHDDFIRQYVISFVNRFPEVKADLFNMPTLFFDFSRTKTYLYA